MRKTPSLLIVVIIAMTGIASATDGVISGNVTFGLGNGVNVTVYGNQSFTSIILYNSTNTTAQNTFELTVNDTAQRFKPGNTISLCSDTCAGIVAPNTSLDTTPTMVFSWNESIPDPNYNYQLSRDIAFVSAFFSGAVGGTPEYTLPQIALDFNQSYWWHVKNASSVIYNRTWEFLTPVAPAVLPGHLNISVFDELNQSPVPFINVTLVSFATNTSVNLSSTGTNNYVNFSSSIIAGQEYLAQVSVVGYTTRNILILSPGNYSVYLPYSATPAGVSQVTFSESDYTGLFPYQSTKLIIQKVINNTIVNISSDYFNAVGTSTTQLINGQQYQIVVESPSSTRSLGSYIPTASTTSTLLIGTFTLQPAVSYNGLNYSIQYNTNQSIVLQWQDTSGSELISLNETITNSQGDLVLQLITSVDSGQSTYIIANTSERYLVQLNISTAHNRNIIVSNWWNAATFTLIKNANNYIISNTLPQWIKNALSVSVLFIMYLLFNREHILRGSVVVCLFAALFWATGLMVFDAGYVATGAMVGVAFVISITALLGESNKG